MLPFALFIFVIQLFYGIQALECEFSVARGHFDEVQRLLQNCIEIKDFDTLRLRNKNFLTLEFVTRTDRPYARNNFSLSLKLQSDEADDANPQSARIAQIRQRKAIITENHNHDARTLASGRGEEIGHQNIPMNRNESFRIQTPIITIQLPNSNDSIGPDYSSDQDEDQDQTKATDEAEQSQETNASVNHCIIRCLLEQMNVINKTGFPDRQKLAKELLKNVIGRDAEEFFQDSINDCYRQMDGRYLDKCEFSTELILCLINKGKANCNDWPVGIFPYHS